MELFRVEIPMGKTLVLQRIKISNREKSRSRGIFYVLDIFMSILQTKNPPRYSRDKDYLNTRNSTSFFVARSFSLSRRNVESEPLMNHFP
jgi:hypothetical protein